MSTQDYERLADDILTFARTSIVEHGGLFPVAASVANDGSVTRLASIHSIDANVDTPEIIEEIVGVLQALARNGQVRAVAWCIDVRLVPPGETIKTDALILYCESASHESLVLITPYRDAPGESTVFVEPYVQKTTAQVFLEPTGTEAR